MTGKVNEKRWHTESFRALKDRLPTSTIHQSRVQLFEPTRRPTLKTRTVVTPWGDATIEGRLGQGHADVLEAMSRFAHDWQETTDGGLELIVDKYLVRKSAAGGGVGSGEQLKQIIRDLARVSVELNIRQGNFVLNVQGHLIDIVEQSEELIDSSGRFGLGGQRGRARPYMRVKFGRPIVDLFIHDLRLYYDPTSIARLRHGVSQALARHVMSHKAEPRGGWILNNLLKTIGAGEPNELGNRRRELRRDSDELRQLGIIIEGTRVHLDKKTSV